MIDVERPAAAPPSLAQGKAYNERDVLAALHQVFLGKCYLCETPVMVGTFEVDHRKPKGEDRFKALTYAWTNLFPICNEFGCNQRRPRTYPNGGLLDPGGGVETRVLQRVDGPVSISLRKARSVVFVFESVDPEDTEAENTAKELDRIHNGTGSSAHEKVEALRVSINEHIVTVVPQVMEYLALLHNPTASKGDVARQRQRVETLLSRRAPYAMLTRSLFSSNAEVRALFD